MLMSESMDLSAYRALQSHPGTLATSLYLSRSGHSRGVLLSLRMRILPNHQFRKARRNVLKEAIKAC
eukprot:12204429-Prorocentrum_lima.AAC.1